VSGWPFHYVLCPLLSAIILEGKMFKIGNVPIKNRVVAAPLAGVTDRAFRIIAQSMGCGLVFTEMISDMGLVYGQSRTLQIADTSDETGPVAVQIFGSQPGPMAGAAAIVADMGAEIIDINMGCPTPKIVKNGEGAALMLDIDRSRQIIREVVQAVQVPVTVKLRKGWDDTRVNCLEMAQIAQEEGARAVTLHPRTRMQFFSGQADWDMIKNMKKAWTSRYWQRRYMASPGCGAHDKLYRM
jgi:nifR3 family TIM-barrel protein